MSDRQKTWRSTSTTGAFVEEILHKYNCYSETDNFFSRMSSQALADRIASLKGHVFSNTNSHSDNCDQTNNCEGGEIDLSNNTPPLRQRMLTYADVENNQSTLQADSSKSVKESDQRGQTKPSCCASNTKTNEDILDLSAEINSNLALTSRTLPGDGEFGLSTRSSASSSCDKTDDNEDVICLDHSNLLVTTPVVVITPAVMEECVDEGKTIAMVDTNGDLSATMLAKDSTDTCSLSSYGSCSENEILTDDEPSDDEMRQPLEDKSDKVPKQNSNLLKIQSLYLPSVLLFAIRSCCLACTIIVNFAGLFNCFVHRLEI